MTPIQIEKMEKKLIEYINLSDAYLYAAEWIDKKKYLPLHEKYSNKAYELAIKISSQLLNQ